MSHTMILSYANLEMEQGQAEGFFKSEAEKDVTLADPVGDFFRKSEFNALAVTAKAARLGSDPAFLLKEELRAGAGDILKARATIEAQMFPAQKSDVLAKHANGQEVIEIRDGRKVSVITYPSGGKVCSLLDANGVVEKTWLED